jgi:hypothetical protein
MPLPEFTSTGDLPVGVHGVGHSEIGERFGKMSVRRVVLFGRLQRVLNIARATGHLAKFIVFGSFVTTKAEPNDVDIFLLMEDSFDVSLLHGESRLVFDHPAAQDFFGCSIFWLRRLAALGGAEAAVSQWQIKRDGTLRGILEITGEP